MLTDLKKLLALKIQVILTESFFNI